MAEINIADYKRPGIFIREIDASVRQVPAQTELINLVAGFSRKGPINKPILINTPQELFEIFGDIDRLMEKRGCYFHRTIANILRNGPVWALNLLKTDEELDLIQWKSISTSSNVQNSIVKTAPYENFFDRADFWERDTDAFLTVAEGQREDERHILHVTNMSDKKVSVFMYHNRDIAGYDDTLEVYYGSIDSVPLYLNANDQAKDYIVSMAIVAGDWSDYQTLSVDTRWSQYFNTNGLRKNQIQNFINDQAVNLLKFYPDLSLIPYFRDLNNRDLFIETVVNRDTDIHGIFVAYDIDRVEDAEFRTGVLDLIGSNLVDDPEEIIEYLSYNEVITEDILFETVELNRAGNAFGKELEYECKFDGSAVFIETPGAGLTEVTISGINYYNLNGVKVTPDASSLTVEIVNANIGKIRKDTLYMDASGALGVETGFEVSNQTTWANVPLKPLASGLLPIAIVNVGQQAQSTSGSLAIDEINNIDSLVWGIGSTSSTVNTVITNLGSTCGTSGTAFCGFSTSFLVDIIQHDIAITYNGTNEINFEFTGTKNSDPDTNYRKSILNKLFNDLQGRFIVGASVILDASDNKIVVTDATFETDADENKSLTITVLPSIDISRTDDARIFFIDDEQNFFPDFGTETYGLRTTKSTSGAYGVASVNSKIYKAFKDGQINSGDFFYPNLFKTSSTLYEPFKFEKVDIYNNLGNSYITLWYNSGDIDPLKLSVNRKIRLFGTEANNKEFTILNNGGAVGSQPGDYNTKLDLIVNESVTTESLLNAEVSVHGASDSDKRYLKMYFVGSELYVDFTQDETLIGTNSLNFVQDFNMKEIRVFSNRSDFKQSLEIETVLESNEILVNAERYGEVKIGDYLQAYVDESELEAGEVPKRLTRIIDKQLYAGDTTLVSIKTDSAIDVIAFGDDKQTFRYTVIEDYVNTYNAVVLGGFKMREDSLPNGTEERQSDILDLLAVGTPLFKGLINRNKISWRYLVDPWGLGLTSNSKQQLVDLCGEKLTALGLLNMPSAKSFKKSTSPSFINQDDKTLNTEYIRLGADPASNPAFRYTFGQGKGQSNVAYFFPYCTISDNSRPIDVPPAMFVANTFLRKHTSRLASVKPWTVAAGITNGLVTGIGNVEMDFTNEDIENLNLMNANPIVFKMNRGFVIETDNTAQVSPRSALSYTHVREVLVELENEMYEMLLTYQWRFNTREVRAEIKANADRICERYVREDGLFAFENVMDETNNTPEIIDAQIGVIDTFVEPIKAMGVIVNNVTVLKTGDIAAGGFRDV
jgi:hypothetical protein